MKNFLVTSLGRCGTLFLARTFDRSPSWKVSHEVRGDNRACRTGDFALIVNRRQRDGRGEVNSCLRFAFPCLKARRRAIILRKPEAIIRSGLNRNARWRTKTGFCELVNEVAFGLQLLDRWIELKHADYFVRFEDLFSHVDKVLELARFLGVSDLERDHIRMDEPANQCATTYRDLSSFRSSQHLLHSMDWFRSKYYPEEVH